MKEESMEKLIDKIVKATDSTEEEISAAANSPFLYRRLRNAIEEKKTKTAKFFWGELFATFKIAALGMAAVALLAIGVLVVEQPKDSHKRPSIQTGNGQKAPSPSMDENEELFADSIGLPNATKEVKEVKK